MALLNGLKPGLWEPTMHMLASLTRHPDSLILVPGSGICNNSLGNSWNLWGNTFDYQSPFSSKTELLIPLKPDFADGRFLKALYKGMRVW